MERSVVTDPVSVFLFGYPQKPDDLDVNQAEWEAYCRDMEEMRLEYERLVFGSE